MDDLFFNDFNADTEHFNTIHWEVPDSGMNSNYEVDSSYGTDSTYETAFTHGTDPTYETNSTYETELPTYEDNHQEMFHTSVFEPDINANNSLEEALSHHYEPSFGGFWGDRASKEYIENGDTTWYRYYRDQAENCNE